MISSIFQALFFIIKIQPNMSEQEKKRQRISDYLTLKPSQSFIVYRIQGKEDFLQQKSFLRKRGIGGLNKKGKRRLFNCFC